MNVRLAIPPPVTHRPYKETRNPDRNSGDSLLPLYTELPRALDELYELAALAVTVETHAALGNGECGIDGGCAFELRIAHDHAERCNGCGKAEISAGMFEGLPAIDQWKHQRPGIASIGVLVVDLYCKRLV